MTINLFAMTSVILLIVCFLLFVTNFAARGPLHLLVAQFLSGVAFVASVLYLAVR